MNFLTISVKETFQSIFKHKKFFIVLLLLQIFIFPLFAVATFNYAIKIISNLETISQSTQQDNNLQNTDQQIQNALTISTQLKQIIQHLNLLGISLAIIFIFGNGLLWSLSHKLISRKDNNQIQWKIFFENVLHQWLKFTATSIILFTPFFLIAYYIITNSINQSIAPETFGLILKTILASTSIVYFFLLITYAQIHEHSWKKYLQQIITSFKKIHYILIITIINLLILASTIYATYRTVTIPNFETLSIILTFIFIILLVLTRLFWIVSIRNITEKY